MKTKIIILLTLIGTFIVPVFSISKIDYKLDNFFKNKIDKKIENKFHNRNIICSKKKYVYDILIKRLSKVKSNKYKNLIAYIVNYTKKRKTIIPECKINNVHNVSNTYNTTSLKSTNLKDPILHYVLDKNLIIKDYKTTSKDFLKLDIEKNNYVLNDYNQIQYLTWKYLFKINDKWFLFKKYYSVVASYKIPKTKWDLIFVKGNKYFMVKKNDIVYFPYVDFLKSFDENKKFLSKKWVYYFDKFYYIKTNTEKIPTWFLAVYKNRLVFFSVSTQFSYIELQNLTNHIFTILTDKYKNTVLIKYQNKVYWYIKWFKLYDLWDVKLYEKVDKNALWDILSHTFSIKTKANIPFAKNFDNKKLSFLYNYMKKNFKYNKKLQDMIWSKKYNEKTFNNYVLTHTYLHKNWDVFYTFKNKEWDLIDRK